MLRGVSMLVLMLSLPVVGWGDVVVIPEVSGSGATTVERLVNPAFETDASGWMGWKQGFEIADVGGRNGTRGVRCVAATSQDQHGVGQLVKLAQSKARPIVASGWSRAENVDGAQDGGYSIYVDITFADGTNLWAQTANFSVGTHDWEQRRLVLMPEKPVESLTMFGLFRGHNGQVWFDDFSLVEAADDSRLFEGVLVGGSTPPTSLGETCGVVAKAGLALSFEQNTGAVESLKVNGVTLGERGLPVFVRDVAAGGDFVAPAWKVESNEGAVNLSGESDTLKLSLSLTVASRDDVVEISGTVQDLSGADRAVTVYVPLPVSGEWTWSLDARREIPARGTCINAMRTGAGATGMRSSYPLAVLTGDKGGLALAVPIDEPRHHRLAYDADLKMFYAAFDFGLSQDTKRFPGAASFRALLYACDPALRFRGALERYYALFPDAFKKRVPREGLWMAFTDIGSVPNADDFGFAFQEGATNPVWDEQHGILTFPYTEPMTTWLTLSPETPRTYDGAIDHLRALIDKKDDPLHEAASIIASSSVLDCDGKSIVSVVNAPWCDGCVFALNADPGIPASEVYPINRGQAELKRLQAAVSTDASSTVKEWARHGTGSVESDTEVRTEGRQSLRLAIASGQTADISQVVHLSQTSPKPLTARARVRVSELTGEADPDCSLYIDLVQADGTPLFCQTIPIEPGTRDFETIEKTIVSDKPFVTATVHLLLRGKHTGTVWFDDLFLGEEGGSVNLLKNPGLEGDAVKNAVADGVYIDSYEFWANTINHARAQFANVNIPLVFDAQSHRVGILTAFSTFAFQRELASRMHADGKFVMANDALRTYDFPAAHLDVLGTETNWMPGGKWQPMSDADLCYRRALCHQKPYCFLMNTHYDDFSLELTERYMHRALAYGMFPGFFSENAATNAYFENPKWYEAARPLFKKYTPLIRSVAAAGWQPVTHAKANSDAVYVERFGGAKDGVVYFTVFNDSSVPQKAAITFELDALGWPSKTCTVHEMLSDADLVNVSGNTVNVDLAPEQAVLLKVEPAIQ